jgi:glycosyltransferase involved in cell wall biosynthesis
VPRKLLKFTEKLLLYMAKLESIRVAYDISVLGRGYLDVRSRTGIFRAIESLLHALLVKADADIRTVALSNVENYWDEVLAAQYCEKLLVLESSSYDSVYLSRLGLKDIYGFLSQRQRAFISTIQKSRFHDFYRVAFGLRLLLLPLLKLDLNYQFQAFDYQVYHSPFFKLPDRHITGKLPRILTIYDLIPVLYPEFTSRQILKKYQDILNSLDVNRDWVICDSINTRNDVCEYLGIDPYRVAVTPLAADQKFQPVACQQTIDSVLAKHHIPKHPYLLSLCTLEPRKNLRFLVKCFSKLVLEQPEFGFNLVLVGAIGWKNQALFQELFSQDPILKSRVILAGYVPDRDLSAIYSGATAFLYPSLYEGFGLPPLEAMQCGVPVITSNTSSLPEVVGDAGLMIDPTDEDALCQAILNLVNNGSLRAELAHKSLERARQFSWPKCAEQTAEVYRITAENPA